MRFDLTGILFPVDAARFGLQSFVFIGASPATTTDPRAIGVTWKTKPTDVTWQTKPTESTWRTKPILITYAVIASVLPALGAFTSSAIGGDTLSMTNPYLPTAVSHAVFYDGKFYGNSYYDEGGKTCSVVDWSNSTIGDNGPAITGLEQHGGLAVCANSTYIYSTQWVRSIGAYADTWPTLYPGYVNYGSNVYDVDAWEGVVRRSRSTRAPSLFAGGKLWTGQPDDTTGCLKVLHQYQWWDHNAVILERSTAELKGIACTETEVFVSHPYTSSVYVLDAETMALVRTLPIANAGPLAIAADGNLWVRRTIGQIRKYNSTTGALMGVLSSSAFADRIGVLADGRLWQSNANDFKIYIRSATGATIEEVFGNSILAEGGTISTTQPNIGPTIGFHYDGTHYYVMHEFIPNAYGVLAVKYNAGGVEQKRFTSTHFLETGDIDVSENKYYSHYHRFSFDRNANPQTVLEAYTYDQNNAAADYRAQWFTVSTYFREFLGRKWLYEFSQMGRQLTWREIVPGVNRNRPAGMYTQANFWRPTDDGTAAPVLPSQYISDPRGNQSGTWVNGYVDTEGTIWTTVLAYPLDYIGFGSNFALYRHACLGLDTNNNPIYDWSTGFEEIPTAGLIGDNGEQDAVMRFYYDPESDVAIVTGYTASHPGEPYDPEAVYRYRYEGCGEVIRCYGNWRGRNGSRYVKWTIFPTIGSAILIKSLHFAKHLLVLGFMADPRIELRSMIDGSLFGTIPAGDNTYWIDAHHGVRVVALDDWNYRVIQEVGIGGAAKLHNVTLTAA